MTEKSEKQKNSTQPLDQFDFEEDYQKVMKEFVPLQNNLSNPAHPQWSKPGDNIQKFSLYEDSPFSITSTETLAPIIN